ncbi:10403_t:CDS:2 [Ambispora leptoticha]|uniref:10403_t:CDS:1 n=1 Tax=Ambispora leptoticha TaxID=144679 RepID=A0A9N9CME6_9GLOM|nr:10403_t:CDS:2 [Ambispora leptoticha]
MASSNNGKKRKPSNTKAAIASRVQRNRVKEQGATISNLNRQLSDLTQKLEIMENNNKNLFELKEQVEQRLEDCKKSKEQVERQLDDYKKRTEETLTAKNSIIYAKDFIILELLRNNNTFVDINNMINTEGFNNTINNY